MLVNITAHDGFALMGEGKCVSNMYSGVQLTQHTTRLSGNRLFLESHYLDWVCSLSDSDIVTIWTGFVVCLTAV